MYGKSLKFLVYLELPYKTLPAIDLQYKQKMFQQSSNLYSKKMNILHFKCFEAIKPMKKKQLIYFAYLCCYGNSNSTWHIVYTAARCTFDCLYSNVNKKYCNCMHFFKLSSVLAFSFLSLQSKYQDKKTQNVYKNMSILFLNYYSIFACFLFGVNSKNKYFELNQFQNWCNRVFTCYIL